MESLLNAMGALLDSSLTRIGNTLKPVTKQLYDLKSVPWLENIFVKVEDTSGQKRENLLYGLVSFLVLYGLMGSMVQILVNLVGFVYPAFCSIKAVRSLDKTDDTQWLVYWIVFAFYSILDVSAFSHVPFYWLAKISFLLYLYLPAFRGAETLYTNFIDPLIIVIEQNFTPKKNE